MTKEVYLMFPVDKFSYHSPYLVADFESSSFVRITVEYCESEDSLKKIRDSVFKD